MSIRIKRLKRRKIISEINVVPYIDEMLVLLVIFMVTAPLITTGILNLPEVSKTAPKERKCSYYRDKRKRIYKNKISE